MPLANGERGHLVLRQMHVLARTGQQPMFLDGLLDILPALKDEDSYGVTRHTHAQSPQRVPASASGLIAPALHRRTSGIPALKY